MYAVPNRTRSWLKFDTDELYVKTPEEMAAMAVYLASAHGKNITGQCVNVDGGFVMHW